MQRSRAAARRERRDWVQAISYTLAASAAVTLFGFTYLKAMGAI